MLKMHYTLSMTFFQSCTILMIVAILLLSSFISNLLSLKLWKAIFTSLGPHSLYVTFNFSNEHFPEFIELCLNILIAPGVDGWVVAGA